MQIFYVFKIICLGETDVVRSNAAEAMLFHIVQTMISPTDVDQNTEVFHRQSFTDSTKS